MASDMAVRVRGLGKEYRIYRNPWNRVGEWLTGGKYQKHDSVWALKNINFDLPRGAALGVVGANGAGKSTLLKIINGASPATTGSVEVNGVLGSLLELGTGFHPGFTGRANIYMNAAIMGIPKEEVDERFDEIAEFAELGDYLRRPVRTYSSGMTMRLGFATAMLSSPEILILDEVFAVGDQAFQQKCVERVREIRRGGSSLLFVSHSLYHIRQMCDRALWIQGGEMVMEGDPIEVTDEYVNWIHSKGMPKKREVAERLFELGEQAPDGLAGAPHLGDMKITRPGENEPCDTFVTGEEAEFHFTAHNPRRQGKVCVGIIVYRNDEVQCFTSRTSDYDVYGDGEVNEFRMRLPLPLLAGEFSISGYLLDETAEHVLDQRLSWGRFKMNYSGMEKGIFHVEPDWQVRSEIKR